MRVAGLVVTLVVAGAISAACGSSAPTTAAPPSHPIPAASPAPSQSREPGSSSASTTTAARGAGHAAALIGAVCDDLAGRGFAAVEAYPERGTRPDATSTATPDFWVAAGFAVVVDDERFPVVRRELA